MDTVILVIELIGVVAFAISGAVVAIDKETDMIGVLFLSHITTFGGHPVCCAAGLAAFRYLKKHNVVAEVERKGALYEELLGGHPAVKEIRRSGLLLAVELGSEERLFRIMEIFKEEGIMSDWFLYCATAFRISPPLVISEEEVRDSAAIILRALDRL